MLSVIGFTRYWMKVRDWVWIITSAGIPGEGWNAPTRASSAAVSETRTT